MASATPTKKKSVVIQEEDFFDDVCDELRCVVCRSVLVDPRVLHCHHTFCLRCLFFQVQFDRGERLHIACPFRCPGETVTVGDIRTVPRIPLLSNVVFLARKKMMEAQEHLSAQAITSSEPLEADVALNKGTAPPEATTEAGMTSPTKSSGPAAGKIMECEWCSADSTSCRVCHDCMSRLCNKCRGPFSSHHFLCTQIHQHGSGGPSAVTESRGVVSPLTRAFQEVEASLAAADGAATGTGHAPPRTSAAIQQPHDVAVGVRHFPFLVLPREVQQLVQKHVTKLKLSPLSVHIVDLQKIRLATKLTQVLCSQSASGFSTSYEVIPTLEVGTYQLDIQSTRWGYGHRGTDVLLFLTNVLRVTHTTLENLLSVCREVNVVLGELRSQARKALIEDNQGFRTYGIHVLQEARQYLALANIILSYLMRIRFLEGIMGDNVVNRYHQVWAQLAPSEKHNLRTRCLSFLNTDMELGVELDVAMKRIFSKCDDLKEYTNHLAEELEDQQRLYVQRKRLARQPRPTAVPPCPSAKGVPEETVSNRWFSARGSTAQRRPKVPVKKDRVSDPVSALYADHTFLGQFQEREHSVRGLTQSTLLGLETCLQLRHWVWYFSNTAFRECGAGEEREEKLLSQEKRLQMACDHMLQQLHENVLFCYTYQKAITAKEKEPAFELIDAALNLGLRRGALENDVFFEYDRINSESGEFQKLRRSMLELESNEQFFENVRSFDNQTQIREVMCSVMETYYSVQMDFFGEWLLKEEKQLEELWGQLEEHLAVPKPDAHALLPRRGRPFALVQKALSDTDDDVYRTLAPTLDISGKGRKLHVTDFQRRRSAFSSSSFFGAQLLDVADGVIPEGLRSTDGDGEDEEGVPQEHDEGAHSSLTFVLRKGKRLTPAAAAAAAAGAEPEEREVEFLQSMAAPCLFPNPPVSEANATDDAEAHQMGESLTSRRSHRMSAATSLSERPRLVDELDMNKEEFDGLPMSFRCFVQAPNEEKGEGDAAVAGAELRGTDAEKSDDEKSRGVYTRHDLTLCREHIFAVDSEESDVTILRADPIKADTSGHMKAAVEFKKQFRFAPNKTSTESEASVTVPFYVGTYNYKNSNRFHYFFVDAQSGQVWLTPPEEDHVLFMSKVSRVVGSPLFFLAFNFAVARFASKNSKMLTI